ncbi:MAG TPA: cellulose binding domain-containing protein [Polyangiaceae bacterium]|nr:cellulose binding domain-containing protein [Polyangiaceae bacterium]
MRRLPRLALLAGLCAGACSLQDFSSLDRCAGQPDSAACPLPQAGAPSSSGSGQGGTPTLGGGASEGGAVENAGGLAAGAGYDVAGQGGDGAAGAPHAPHGLRALYAYAPNDPDTPQTSKSIRADLEIVNDSPVEVPLAGITLRYYYTYEAAQNSEKSCLSDEQGALASCSSIAVAFASYSSVSGLANAYFELTFTDDPDAMLGANGGKSGRIKLSVQKPKYALQDLTNDYSYDGSVLALQEWPKVTLQREGELLFGTPP